MYMCPCVCQPQGKRKEYPLLAFYFSSVTPIAPVYLYIISESSHIIGEAVCSAAGNSQSVMLQAIRNPCVTPICVPEGIAWKDVADYAMKK